MQPQMLKEAIMSPRYQPVVQALLVALCTHIALQATRLLFPLTIFQLEVWYGRISQLDIGITLLAAIFAMALAPLLGRALGWRRTLLLGGGTTAILRAVWQVTPAATPNNALLFGLCATALLTLLIAWRCLPSRNWLLGLLGGLALDAALTGLFYTWDYAWQRSPLALGVTLAVCGGLLACAWLNRRADVPERSAPSSALVAVMAYLALQVLYLSNTGYAGLALGTTVAGANALVLLSLAVAGLDLIVPLTMRQRWWLLGPGWWRRC